MGYVALTAERRLVGARPELLIEGVWHGEAKRAVGFAIELVCDQRASPVLACRTLRRAAPAEEVAVVAVVSCLAGIEREAFAVEHTAVGPLVAAGVVEVTAIHIVYAVVALVGVDEVVAVAYLEQIGTFVELIHVGARHVGEQRLLFRPASVLRIVIAGGVHGIKVGGCEVGYAGIVGAVDVAHGCDDYMIGVAFLHDMWVAELVPVVAGGSFQHEALLCPVHSVDRRGSVEFLLAFDARQTGVVALVSGVEEIVFCLCLVVVDAARAERLLLRACAAAAHGFALVDERRQVCGGYHVDGVEALRVGAVVLQISNLELALVGVVVGHRVAYEAHGRSEIGRHTAIFRRFDVVGCVGGIGYGAGSEPLVGIDDDVGIDAGKHVGGSDNVGLAHIYRCDARREPCCQWLKVVEPYGLPRVVVVHLATFALGPQPCENGMTRKRTVAH